MASTVFDAEPRAQDYDGLAGRPGHLGKRSLQGLSPEQQFQLFANALAGVVDASTRAALAQDVFGRSGTQLLPLFTQGEQGMAPSGSRRSNWAW